MKTIHKKPQGELRTLAKATLEALVPYVNVYDAGVKVNGVPLHVITKETRDLFFRHKKGESGLKYSDGYNFRPRDFGRNILSEYNFRETISGSRTYYYTSGTRGKALLYLDVDAHHGEDDQNETADAIQNFLGQSKLLRRDSARGVNLYLKLDYGEFTKRDLVNAAIRDFEQAWKRFQTASGFKCGVEVKGTITTRVKSGSLAKLPCGKGWDALDLLHFESLPEVSLKWLKGATVALIERAEKIEREKPQLATTVIQAPKSRLRAGSCTGLPLSTDELDALPQALASYQRVALHCYAFHVSPNSKTKKLVTADFAQALVVLSICAKYPNKDGSNPTKRIRAIWNALYDDGVFTRGFDNCRWKAIRDTLADLDYIDIQDERFWWFDNGEKKGQAMKWCLKAAFVCSFESVQTFNTSSTPSHSIFVRSIKPAPHCYLPCRWRPEEINMQSAFREVPDFEERLLAILETG